MGMNTFHFPVLVEEDGNMVEEKISVKCVEEMFQMLKCFYC